MACAHIFEPHEECHKKDVYHPLCICLKNSTFPKLCISLEENSVLTSTDDRRMSSDHAVRLGRTLAFREPSYCVLGEGALNFESREESG